MGLRGAGQRDLGQQRGMGQRGLGQQNDVLQ